jgi:hypothetical protein
MFYYLQKTYSIFTLKYSIIWKKKQKVLLKLTSSIYFLLFYFKNWIMKNKIFLFWNYIEKKQIRIEPQLYLLVIYGFLKLTISIILDWIWRNVYFYIFWLKVNLLFFYNKIHYFSCYYEESVLFNSYFITTLISQLQISCLLTND